MAEEENQSEMSDCDREEEFQTEMKKLVAKRGHLKAQLTRFSTFVNANDDNPECVVELTRRMQKTEYIYERFMEIQADIELICDSKEQYAERVEFEDRFFDITSKATQMIDAFDQKSRNVMQQVQQQQTLTQPQAVTLPPVTIREFCGNYEKWTSFRDAYVSLIHNNTNLARIQKFFYLKSVLKDDALKIIESLEVSDVNYDTAWDLLNERFDNEKLIIKTHVKQIFSLPNIVKDSNVSLRGFIDTFQTHFRALKNLNEPVDSWNSIILHLLSEKLDFHTRREWEIKSRDDKKPKIVDFIKFLTDKCKVLEATETKPSTVTRNQGTKKQFAGVTTSSYKNCLYCKGKEHNIYACKDFLKLAVSERIEEIHKLKACKNCLYVGHYSFKCRSGGCKTCGKKHNSLLHLNQKETEKEMQREEEQDSCSKVTTMTQQSKMILETVHSVQNEESFTLLSTAQVYVYDQCSRPILCKALLDNGAQSNFITTKLFKALNLEKSNVKLSVVGINESATRISHCTDVTIKSARSNYEFKTRCLVIDKITGCIPQRTFERALMKIPYGIELADPQFNVSSEIDLLLGADMFYDLIETDKIVLGKGLPTLVNTKLGWILGGTFNKNEETNSFCNFSQSNRIEERLEAFWKIEECPDKEVTLSKEEEECERHFKTTFKRDEVTGQFIVKLPFNENLAKLGESKESAIRRFYSQERKLERELNRKQSYTQFMTEYEELGHMRRISNDETTEDKDVCYLPHHGVIKDSSRTTKLRVVFDASMKTSTGISLNDTLMKGPCIQDTIFEILTRFRIHTIAFTADIAKMYRCIKVHPEDAKYQRIVWRDKPDQELVHYELSTLTYGTTPASFIATRCLKQLSMENAEKAEVARAIAEDFYMDDWLGGSDDWKEAAELINQVDKILSSAGFILRQWSSSDDNLIKNIASEVDGQESHHIVDDKQGSKTLGILWNSNKDVFQYTVNCEENTYFTKRIVLSIISQIF